MTAPSRVSENRIRERAYLLWLEEGQPEGRSAEHWEKARELLAVESGPADADQGKLSIVKDNGKQKAVKKGSASVSKHRPM